MTSHVGVKDAHGVLPVLLLSEISRLEVCQSWIVVLRIVNISQNLIGGFIRTEFYDLQYKLLTLGTHLVVIMVKNSGRARSRGQSEARSLTTAT
jgi:hypothetical protein